MIIALHVIAGPDTGQVFQLVEGKPLLLGRSRHCHSPLNDMAVSRVHCEVELEDGQVVVTDHDSAGGTFVSGRRVTEAVMQPGEVLQIGETRLRLQAPEGPAATRPPTEVLRGNRLQELTGRKLSHFHVGPARTRGQSGVVFEARDFRDNSLVALKVLFPLASGNNQELRRFVRSMKTALPLRHANLVAVRAAGKSGPYCWAAMEMVEGESLAEVLERPAPDGTPDWKLAQRVGTHLARALEYAHAHHIIHRNLTPRNVLIRGSDTVVKLGDLMLAKALQGTLAEQLTRPGELLGDVRFMARERARVAEHVDQRSDLFSLGSLLYTILAGRAPFEGRTPVEVLTKIRQADPKPLRQLQPGTPAALEAVIGRLMAKRPEARYPSAVELLADLDRFAEVTGVRA
jgi:serine/threonine protein kinase